MVLTLIFFFIGNDLDDRPRNIAEFVLSIELKVSYGPYLTIVENIEWDLSNPDNCPE